MYFLGTFGIHLYVFEISRVDLTYLVGVSYTCENLFIWLGCWFILEIVIVIIHSDVFVVVSYKVADNIIE